MSVGFGNLLHSQNPSCSVWYTVLHQRWWAGLRNSCSRPSMGRLYSDTGFFVLFLPDLPHMLHSEFELLPSGRRYRVLKCKLNSFKYSFVPTSKFSMAPEGVEIVLYVIWGCMECAIASWYPTFFECVLFFLFLHYVQWVMYSMFLFLFLLCSILF